MTESRKLQLNTGHKMDLIGLGTWKSGPGQVKAAVGAAIDCGYRHIDCAWLYQNEKEIGEAIDDKIKDGAVARADMFIVSKLWNIFHDPEDVRKGFMQTLKALKLDYLDLYLMHSPMGYKNVSKEAYEGEEMKIGLAETTDRVIFPRDPETQGPLSSDTDYVDTWKEMEKLVDEGLVRSIGVSNFNKFQIERICTEGKIAPAVHQFELHPYLTQIDMVNFCQEKDIAVTAYSPFGSPDRPWKPEDEEPLTSSPVIKRIAARVGRSPFQVVLRYLNQRNIIAIPKSATPKNMQSNLAIFDFYLTNEDMKCLNDLNKGHHAVSFDWDKGHRYFPFVENYSEK